MKRVLLVGSMISMLSLAAVPATAVPCSGQFSDASALIDNFLKNSHALAALQEAATYAHDGVKLRITETPIIDALGRETGTRYDLSYYGYFVQPVIVFEDSPVFYKKAELSFVSLEQGDCKSSGYAPVKKTMASKAEYESIP